MGLYGINVEEDEVKLNTFISSIYQIQKEIIESK